ncbi:MAG: hypothetical protein CM15mP120_09670 [Pseudomonadota bacterium]|nr:MAG: hypothetical protein CM15mP120_09670 [Pseudomonadota bacterium]
MSWRPELKLPVGDGMLISPSGATADTRGRGNIVKVSLGGQWEGERKPSSEWRMHAAIYEAHEKTNAVVHTTLTTGGVGLPAKAFARLQLSGSFGGKMSHVSRIPRFTQSLGDDAAAALKDRSACLLGKHGMISRDATWPGVTWPTA